MSFLLLVSCILIYMEVKAFSACVMHFIDMDVKAFSACVMYCYIHGRFKLDIILIINQI